jgi:hypothetical protein
MQISVQCMGVDNLWLKRYFIINHTSLILDGGIIIVNFIIII